MQIDLSRSKEALQKYEHRPRLKQRHVSSQFGKLPTKRTHCSKHASTSRVEVNPRDKPAASAASATPPPVRVPGRRVTSPPPAPPERYWEQSPRAGRRADPSRMGKTIEKLLRMVKLSY